MICNIQKFLTQDACTTLVLGLCISHLDYATTLFYGLPDKKFHIYIGSKQCVQNLLSKNPILTAQQRHWHNFTDSQLDRGLTLK